LVRILVRDAALGRSLALLPAHDQLYGCYSRLNLGLASSHRYVRCAGGGHCVAERVFFLKAISVCVQNCVDRASKPYGRKAPVRIGAVTGLATSASNMRERGCSSSGSEV
jgi:hypothetical protein